MINEATSCEQVLGTIFSSVAEGTLFTVEPLPLEFSRFQGSTTKLIRFICVMGKRKSRSSDCTWTKLNNPLHASKIIDSLKVVKSATIISADAHSFALSRSSTTVNSTLGDLIESSFYIALSLAKNDGADSILVTNDRVIMHLSPESFASFGLDGKKFGNKYLVIYELNNTGNRKARLDWALKNTILEKFNFIVYSDKPASTKVQTKMLDILVPPLAPVDPVGDENSFLDWSNSTLEWIALASLSPKLLALNNGGVDPSLCDYHQPEGGKRQPASVTSITGNGLTSIDLQSIWEKVKSQNWAVMHVVGFENAPLAWNSQIPHATGKEFGYTIIKSNESMGCFKFVAS